MSCLITFRSLFPLARSPLGNNSLLNFTRGSLIELSNGSMRRVEDLRTEDFIMSAEKSTDLQLADSTVVKIISSNNNNCVMITFSYDNNRSKVSSSLREKLEFLQNNLKILGRHRSEVGASVLRVRPGLGIVLSRGFDERIRTEVSAPSGRRRLHFAETARAETRAAAESDDAKALDAAATAAAT